VSRRGRALPLILACVALTGCVRGCPSSRPPIHVNPNMDLQPKAKAQSESGFFYDGQTMRLPVPGTVARGELTDDSAFFTGLGPDGGPVAEIPVPVTPELLARGEQRFSIYCQPCHDKNGNGTGILYQRAGVSTTSLHEQRLLDSPAGHFFKVINEGVGLMPSYRWAIRVEDRWAIIAWVYRLQGRSDTAVAVETGE